MLIKIRMHENFEELVIHLQLYWYLNFQYTIQQISKLENLAILTKKSKMVTIVTIKNMLKEGISLCWNIYYQYFRT